MNFFDFFNSFLGNMYRDAAYVMIAVGSVVTVIGIIYLWNRYEDPHTNKVGPIALSGGLGLIAFGLACIVIPLNSRPWRIPPPPPPPPSPSPSSIESTLSPRLTPSPTKGSLSPSPSPTLTPNPVRVSFQTPGGVRCSTFVNYDAIACVVPTTKRTWSKGEDDDFWKRDDCKYLFVLSRRGSVQDELNDQGHPTRVTRCPNEDSLTQLLYDYPGNGATMTQKEYGKKFSMGSAVCTVEFKGTTCLNEDGYGFTLSLSKHIIDPQL